VALTFSESPVKITDWFSYRLSITFNPAGCSRVQGREPVATNMQYRKRECEIEGFKAVIWHSAIPGNLLSQQAVKNSVSHLFQPSKNILLAERVSG